MSTSFNVIRKGNHLLNADIIHPETSYATFNEGLAEQTKDELTLALQHGDKMLHLYESFRDNLHISNVTSMIEEMEKLYHEWQTGVYAARRNASRKLWKDKEE